jgi:hypothetical protein
VKLSELDGCRIAVVLERHDAETVICGWARYEVDEDLGNCLRVQVPETTGDPVFLFPEGAEGDFEPDRQYGCDYVVRVEVDSQG